MFQLSVKNVQNRYEWIRFQRNRLIEGFFIRALSMDTSIMEIFALWFMISLSWINDEKFTFIGWASLIEFILFNANEIEATTTEKQTHIL